MENHVSYGITVLVFLPLAWKSHCKSFISMGAPEHHKIQVNEYSTAAGSTTDKKEKENGIFFFFLSNEFEIPFKISGVSSTSYLEIYL